MTYGLTPAGFVLKTFDVIRSEIDDSQRTEIDAGLDLSDDDPLGQINASHTLQLAILWEQLQAQC